MCTVTVKQLESLAIVVFDLGDAVEREDLHAVEHVMVTLNDIIMEGCTAGNLGIPLGKSLVDRIVRIMEDGPEKEKEEE